MKRFVLASVRIASLMVVLGVLFVCCMAGSMIARSLADKPDAASGPPNVGDRVIYFTDINNDGLFERNVAFVIDDVNNTATLDGVALDGHQRVNLHVLLTAGTIVDGKFIPTVGGGLQVRSVARGRGVGEYESLSSSNH